MLVSITRESNYNMYGKVGRVIETRFQPTEMRACTDALLFLRSQDFGIQDVIGRKRISFSKIVHLRVRE